MAFKSRGVRYHRSASGHTDDPESRSYFAISSKRETITAGIEPRIVAGDVGEPHGEVVIYRKLK